MVVHPDNAGPADHAVVAVPHLDHIAEAAGVKFCLIVAVLDIPQFVHLQRDLEVLKLSGVGEGGLHVHPESTNADYSEPNSLNVEIVEMSVLETVVVGHVAEVEVNEIRSVGHHHTHQKGVKDFGNQLDTQLEVLTYLLDIDVAEHL